MNRLLVLFILMMVAPFSSALEDNDEINKMYVKLQVELPTKGQLINVPFAERLISYGSMVSSSLVKREEIPGDKALRTVVRRRASNAWDGGVSGDIYGDVKSGDTMFMAFAARVVKKDADTPTTFIRAGLQQKVHPYTPIMIEEVEIGPEWDVYFVSGVATKTIKDRMGQSTFQIAGDKHTLEFGPLFVFNLGPGVDQSKLPQN